MSKSMILAVLLLSACSTGPCLPEKGGPEIGFVPDVEHDANGNPLTGLPLFFARLSEAIASPFCVAPPPK